MWVDMLCSKDVNEWTELKRLWGPGVSVGWLRLRMVTAGNSFMGKEILTCAALSELQRCE